jgi:hypothetical protein
MNEITPDPNGMQHKNFVWKKEVGWQLLAVVFVLIWTLNFISDQTGFICMMSASHFYFTSEGFDGKGAVMESVGYTYKYHLGSLALGSLINSIVEIIAAIVDGIANQAQ